MIAAVIPVKNEASTIRRVIKTLLDTGVDLLVPVLNGCEDDSLAAIQSLGLANVQPLWFDEPLGIDVPRTVGAAWAYKKGAQTILFVDGDMAGDISGALKELVRSIEEKNVQIALTDCYPPEEPARLSSLASYLLSVRILLSRAIGLEKEIGSASPAHGPHAISRAFLEKIPLRELAIPPVALALAAKKGCAVGIGTRIPHIRLGSPQRDPVHCHRIAETIIGDCLEAMQAYREERRDRSRNGITYLGYHVERRFDLLEKFVGEAI